MLTLKRSGRVLILFTALLAMSDLGAQAVSITPDGQAPHASAMLDVQGTARGVLFPGMNSADRIGIPMPATGLMVYDLDTDNFWCYTGSVWIEIKAGVAAILSDADGDTKIEVEATPDEDTIRFSAAGIELMKMDHKTLHLNAPGHSVYIGASAGSAALPDSAIYNVFVGHAAGRDNTSGQRNIAIGANTLVSNTGSSHNIAIGDSVLHFNGTGSTMPEHGSLNTGIGSMALQSNTTGYQNQALGAYSLRSNTTGAINTGIGHNALSQNTSGARNTATGAGAMGLNTGGNYNVAVGDDALFANQNGSFNTAIGSQAMSNAIAGNFNSVLGSLAAINNRGNGNTVAGYESLYSNISGTYNVAIGIAALRLNNLHSRNVAVGDSALCNNGFNIANLSLAIQNTGIGSKALFANTSGYSNTSVGFNAMYSNTIGFHNTAIGNLALNENTGGDYNLAAGSFALQKNTSNRNVALGPVALRDNISGTQNVAVGVDAGQKNTGSDNVFIGFEAGRDNLGTGNLFIGKSVGNTATGSNRLMIDNSNTSTPLIQGDFNTNTLGINGTFGVGVTVTDSRVNINSGAGEDPFRVRVDNSTKFYVHNNGGILMGHNDTPTYGLQLPNSSTQLVGQAVAFAWNIFSEERIKSDLQPLQYGLKEILQLEAISYLHHSSSTDENGKIQQGSHASHDIGFSAQAVYKILPEVANKPADESISLWSMNYTKLIPVLVQSIQPADADFGSGARKKANRPGPSR